MGDQRVFDGAYLRADLHGNGTEGLFVSFDHFRPDRAGFPLMPPVQAALDQGYASLVISTAANDWFLNPDLPHLRAAVARVAARFCVVRAIGFSMGGYGALLLSKTLRLSFATLWAPQVSIRSRIAPFETRFRPDARRIDAVADQLRLNLCPNLRGALLCDPFAHPAERKHARAIQAFAPALDIVALPFSGHPPTHVVMCGDGYPGLLQAAITGTLAPGLVRGSHVAHRWQSEPYLRGLLAAMNARDARRFARTGS